MRAVCSVLLIVCVAAGCGPDLGMCDEVAAERVVYASDGTPYFEGQALVHQSCAGSFCHAEGAQAAARSGVPHGLNFDVQPLDKQAPEARLTALRGGISRVREEAEELWAQIDSGKMPPGDAGKRTPLTWRDAAGMQDAMLPPISTPAGKDRVRNWLACGSPIVSATKDSPLAGQAMLIGVVTDPGKSSTSASFDSIYADVLTSCKTCHDPAVNFPGQMLDLSSKEAAFTALVNKDAFSGGPCANMGRKLVTPGSCENSLLYVKLQPPGQAPNLCGQPMPLGGSPIPAAQLKAVCDWITAGAMP